VCTIEWPAKFGVPSAQEEWVSGPRFRVSGSGASSADFRVRSYVLLGFLVSGLGWLRRSESRSPMGSRVSGFGFRVAVSGYEGVSRLGLRISRSWIQVWGAPNPFLASVFVSRFCGSGFRVYYRVGLDGRGSQCPKRVGFGFRDSRFGFGVSGSGVKARVSGSEFRVTRIRVWSEPLSGLRRSGCPAPKRRSPGARPLAEGRVVWGLGCDVFV
jgi:hypothetical protein